MKSEAKAGPIARAGLLLRNCLFFGVFSCVTVVISLSVIILSRFPRTMGLRRRLELFWARAAVRASGVRLEADLPTLDPSRNYVFVCNHQSYLDIPVILTLFPEFYPRFLAKDSLFRIPLFGPGMWHTGHFSVDRDNKRQGMKDLNKTVEAVQRGESALVFPEGTRNPGREELQPFQSGAFILLLKSGMPMVPVILDGSGKVLPKGRLRVRPATVRVRALEPVEVADRYTLKDRDRLMQEVRDMMQKEFLELSKWEKETTG